MQFRIRVFYDSHIEDYILNEGVTFTIGSGSHCSLCITNTDIEDEKYGFHIMNGVPYCRTSDGQEHMIQLPAIFLLSKTKKIAVVFHSMNTNVDCKKAIKKTGLLIGSQAQCDICLASDLISKQHARIYAQSHSNFIEDLNSANGVYVNGKRTNHSELINGSVIQLGCYDFAFKDGFLLYCSDRDERQTREQLSKVDYPFFKRSPRLKIEIDDKSETLEKPPTISSKPQINWLSLFMFPAILLIAGVLGMASSMSYMMIFAIASPVVAVVNYNSQKRKHEKEIQLRIDKYREYLIDLQEHVDEAKGEQLKSMRASNPSPTECFEIIKSIDSSLWSRRLSDEDFMSVRIGIGDIEASINLNIPHENLSIHEDELAEKGKMIAEASRIINQAPILCNVLSNRLVGIVGQKDKALSLVFNMIVCMSTTHSYEDLRLSAVFPKEQMKYWDWMRWLPHVFDDTREFRYLACGSFDAANLSKHLEEFFKERLNITNQENTRRRRFESPYYLFIISDIDSIENLALMSFLLNVPDSAGVGAIFICDEIEQLPKECNEIINISQIGTGELFNTESVTDKIKFRIDSFSFSDLDLFARKMAPIRIEEKIKSGKLPKCITFLEGYDVKRPDEISIDELWNNNKTFKSMAVPIGVRANGENFYFDIHEKMHGPHGLVAGTTGSGKSEMVQSWILSMALNFSPQDVSFVLIDFKGTGLILPFKSTKLPHLAGTISNIDTNIHRNLIALENELSRRQVLFNQNKVQNIIDYLKLYHAGKASEPLSFLFVIIDEFAEFKQQFPAFMTVIDRIFAIGRTLGVFNILLSQKPSSVVSDKMNANTRFRWCLKVASSADSKEMLHHPDAAKITVKGRGFVQVGEDEIYEEIQSFWSGAPYDPNRKDKYVIPSKVSTVSLSGKRNSYDDNNGITQSQDETKEIAAIVNYLREYVDKRGIEDARPVWKERLSTHIPLESIIHDVGFDGKQWPASDGELKPVIGVVDDPARQSQYPAIINLSVQGHFGIYGAPSTGKTTLLQTLIMSLVSCYSPADVNIYIMDFNAWSLLMFSEFPHVGGIAKDNDEDKVRKLIQLIDDELNDRRKKFADYSVGSIKAYRDATGEQIPYIVLIIDNFAPVFQLYPDTEMFFINLSRQGGSYGIFIVATANNQAGMSYKMGQNIKNGLALQMADRNEYATIVGKTNGLEPENAEGRGLMKGIPPLEFQTALPVSATEGETSRIIKSIAIKMKKAWRGKSVKPIPIMPDIIHFDSIESDEPIVLGLSVDSVTPISLRFDSTHYLAISGTQHSGKSNMIKIIAKQLHENIHGCKITVYDSDNSLESIKGIIDAHYTTASELDEYMAELSLELQNRLMKFRNGESLNDTQPIFILIDGLKKCFDAISDDTSRRIEQLLALGKGLKVFLVASESNEGLSELESKGAKIAIRLTSNAISVLLGGKAKEHSAIKTTLNYTEQDKKLKEFEGYLICDGEATKFKTMYEQ